MSDKDDTIEVLSIGDVVIDAFIKLFEDRAFLLIELKYTQRGTSL